MCNTIFQSLLEISLTAVSRKPTSFACALQNDLSDIGQLVMNFLCIIGVEHFHGHVGGDGLFGVRDVKPFLIHHALELRSTEELGIGLGLPNPKAQK